MNIFNLNSSPMAPVIQNIFVAAGGHANVSGPSQPTVNRPRALKAKEDKAVSKKKTQKKKMKKMDLPDAELLAEAARLEKAANEEEKEVARKRDVILQIRLVVEQRKKEKEGAKNVEEKTEKAEKAEQTKKKDGGNESALVVRTKDAMECE